MVTTTSKGSVIGIFSTLDRAENAILELQRYGFSDDQVGLIYRNAAGDTVRQGASDNTLAAEGAAVGAGAGALGGALVGWGVWTGLIPVIGPVLAIGALGTVLLNAAGGAALSGLAGALVGWGITDEDARYYEQQVKMGRYLVTVKADEKAELVREILNRFEGYDQSDTPAFATTDAVR